MKLLTVAWQALYTCSPDGFPAPRGLRIASRLSVIIERDFQNRFNGGFEDEAQVELRVEVFLAIEVFIAIRRLDFPDLFRGFDIYLYISSRTAASFRIPPRILHCYLLALHFFSKFGGKYPHPAALFHPLHCRDEIKGGEKPKPDSFAEDQALLLFHIQLHIDGNCRLKYSPTFSLGRLPRHALARVYGGVRIDKDHFFLLFGIFQCFLPGAMEKFDTLAESWYRCHQHQYNKYPNFISIYLLPN